MGNRESRTNAARKKAAKLGFDQAAFTLVVCMDRKKAKCCSSDTMASTWKRIKERVKDFRSDGDGQVVTRVKSQCLGICHGGPIVGVFPDGVWYGGCTPKVIDRIFDEHLKCGNVVREHVIAQPRQKA